MLRTSLATILLLTGCNGSGPPIAPDGADEDPDAIASVEIASGSPTFPLYREPSLSATVRERDGDVRLAAAVQWTSLDLPIATITPGGVLTALSPGQARIVATAGGKADTVTLTATNPVEARALWVTRFDYNSAAKIATIFQKAASANFNVVYFQVRAAGDALYTPRPGSPIEPCSPRLCGTLGGPSQPYDPLDEALRAAAPHGIQVHAWLNALTGWTAGSSASCSTLVAGGTPAHILIAHPEYTMSSSDGTPMPCLTSSEYIWLSPGFAEVRSRLAAVSADLARRYGTARPVADGQLRGIHLDRIRFPGTAWSHDTATVNAYRRAHGASAPVSGANWADFRRGLVNATVRETWDSLQAVHSPMVLSAAVWPSYSTMANWPNPGASYTRGFDEFFQDPRAWVAGAYLDVAVPMTYPGSATSSSYTIKSYCEFLDYECALVDHQAAVEGRATSPRHLYIGVGAIRGAAEMVAQIDIARRRRVSGMSIYSYTLVDGFDGFPLLANGRFKYPATIPAMTWK